MPQVLDKLQNSNPKNFHDQQTIFQNVSTYKLIYHINLGIADGVEDLVDSIEAGIRKYQINFVSQTVLTSNAAILLFIVEKFAKCHHWLLKIIKGEKFDARKDIKLGAYLLNLITAYELDDIDLLESSYRSTYRYINKEMQASRGSFERVLTLATKKLMDATPAEEKKILVKLREKVQEIKQDPNQNVIFGLDDLILFWIESRLKRKSMARVVKDA